jgi:hypothetical protein
MAPLPEGVEMDTRDEIGEPGTGIVRAPEAVVVPERTGDIVVIAKTPAEMEVAQRSLVAWAEARIARLTIELQEAESNLAHAKTCKWKLGPWKRVVEQAGARVTYYSKIKAAIEAGYVIMPDLPGQTFAIRTTLDSPRRREIVSSWRHQNLPAAATDSSPIGEGHYISPIVTYDTWDRSEGEGNQKKTTHHVRASDFTDVDFPMVMVKPQILDETNRAMLLGIFDEVAILPAGSGDRRRLAATQQPDPVIIGRVVRQEGTRRHTCAFLITWWLDTSTI